MEALEGCNDTGAQNRGAFIKIAQGINIMVGAEVAVAVEVGIE